MLEYLYYSKNLKCYSCWEMDSKLYRCVSKYGNDEDGSKDEYTPYKTIVPVVSMSLNKFGISELKKKLKHG